MRYRRFTDVVQMYLEGFEIQCTRGLRFLRVQIGPGPARAPLILFDQSPSVGP